MTNNKQQPKPENPNNQFSNTEPLTHAQRVAIANKMSNNKQSIKLYTEEQVKMLDINCGNSTLDEVIGCLTPIELPSDQEIQNESVKHYDNNGADFYFELGAKWMRDLIQGGNNEQQ